MNCPAENKLFTPEGMTRAEKNMDGQFLLFSRRIHGQTKSFHISLPVKSNSIEGNAIVVVVVVKCNGALLFLCE